MDSPGEPIEETPEKPPEPLHFKARFSLLDVKGAESAGGETEFDLEEMRLLVKIPGDRDRFIPLRDIYEMNAADYCVTLTLMSSERLLLKQMGRDYDNFQRELARRRRDLNLSDLLMKEPLKMGELRAFYRYLDAAGAKGQSGNCELRLYQSALVIVPERFLPVRIPYSDIASAERGEYKLTVRMENGEAFACEQMGRDLDPLERVLREQRESLDRAVQALVKELMPSAGSDALKKLAVLMKEGRAARRADIEAVGAGLWEQLEKHLTATDAGDEYAFLKSLGQAQNICIGVKRGLNQEESDYLWFMVPVYGADTSKPGNAVIMEAVSAEGESRATYAFRIAGRKEYSKIEDIAALRVQMGPFLRSVNRALVAVNFRREPVYLSDEALAQPRYEKYRYSVMRIPELRELRKLYTGRVMHTSPEQWQAGVKDLLAFNVGTTDDGQRWSKKEPAETPETD